MEWRWSLIIAGTCIQAEEKDKPDFREQKWTRGEKKSERVKKLEDFRRALSINSSNLANCRPIGGDFLFIIIIKWKLAQKEQIRHFFFKKKEYFWV